MAHSGFEVSEEAMEAFKLIKGNKGPKMRLLTCDTAKGKVVLHEKDPEDCTVVTLDGIKKLLTSVGNTAVYLLVDFPVGSSAKLLLVKWVPEDCKVKDRMICTSTFDEVKNKLTGCTKYLEFTEFDDFDDLNLSKY